MSESTSEKETRQREAGVRTCFVIMPITTPDHLVIRYGRDTDHFRHVLKCLFVPAIERAGMKPIPPVAKGADLIQANIITNIEQSDLLLCDMSILNPNVFFELGIRTALNKPICMVKDDQTPSVPFDTTIVNHQTYRSSLVGWHLEDDINQLAAHLKESLESNSGMNALWRYFGLSQPGVPYQSGDASAEKLDLLMSLFMQLRNKLGYGAFDGLGSPTQQAMETRQVYSLLRASGYQEQVKLVARQGNSAVLDADISLDKNAREELRDVFKSVGLEVFYVIRSEGPDDLPPDDPPG